MSAAALLKPAPRVHGSASSSFAGVTSAFKNLSIAKPNARPSSLTIEARKECQLTGKVANNGYVVTFSHKRNKKLQHVNLQYKKVYWPEQQRWVKLRISTKAMKTIEKKGLQTMAKEAGLDLFSLPYEDARPQRKEWLAANGGKPPMPKNARKMKNAEKLAASRRTPKVAEYILGGPMIVYRRMEREEMAAAGMQ